MSKVELSGKIRSQEVQMKKTCFTETQIITILKEAYESRHSVSMGARLTSNCSAIYHRSGGSIST